MNRNQQCETKCDRHVDIDGGKGALRIGVAIVVDANGQGATAVMKVMVAVARVMPREMMRLAVAEGGDGDDDTGAGYGDNVDDQGKVDAETVGVVVGDDQCNDHVHDYEHVRLVVMVEVGTKGNMQDQRPERWNRWRW